MKDGIDYLEAEMEKADPWAGLNTGFAQGWRAALEAAHAKAEPAGEAPRYWAATVDRDRPRYWRQNDNGTAEWVYVNRTEPSRYTPAWWRGMPTDLFIPCTTEAEAQRVAGFGEGKA